MLEHHLQKDILDKLVKCPPARFADLKPTNVEGNIFTYHLQQLIKQGIVSKSEDGTYCLTAQGKALGINNKLKSVDFHQQAHSILLLMVRDDDGAWLLRKRLVHPMYGKTGFIHGEPKVHENITDTADKTLLRRTGLSAEFIVAGSGYIRIFQNEELESFTHFTLLQGMVRSGTLIESDATGENRWEANPDFTADYYIPSMRDLAQKSSRADCFFTELTYQL